MGLIDPLPDTLCLATFPFCRRHEESARSSMEFLMRGYGFTDAVTRLKNL